MNRISNLFGFLVGWMEFFERHRKGLRERSQRGKTNKFCEEPWGSENLL